MVAAVVASAAARDSSNSVLTDDSLDRSICPEIKSMTRSVEDDLKTFENFLEELMIKEDVLANFNDYLDTHSERMTTKAAANNKKDFDDELFEEFYVESTCKEEMEKALLEFEQQRQQQQQQQQQQQEPEYDQLRNNNPVTEEEQSLSERQSSAASIQLLSDHDESERDYFDDSGRDVGVDELLAPTQALVRGFLARRPHRLKSLMRRYLQQQRELDDRNNKEGEEGMSLDENDDDDDDDSVDEGTPVGEDDLIVPFQALVRGYLTRLHRDEMKMERAYY